MTAYSIYCIYISAVKGLSNGFAHNSYCKSLDIKVRMISNVKKYTQKKPYDVELYDGFQSYPHSNMYLSLNTVSNRVIKIGIPGD